MDLTTLYEAIVPANIKDIPLVQASCEVFIELLNRNAQIAQRIEKLYSIDDEEWYTLDENGDPVAVTDSTIVKETKDNLKKGLLLTYLSTLYNAIGIAQSDTLIREATQIRNYEDSLIFKEQQDIITSEFLGSFRSVQQSIGVDNAFKYMYQFAKYLETGYMTADVITDSKEPSGFVSNYEGSLHKYYFTNFLHDLAHPAGWVYTYSTVTSILLEDYFGITFKYNLPRISIRNANDKYIFFTQLTKTEFLDTLREAVKSDETRSNTIWMEGPLYYDQDENNTREIYYKKIAEFNFIELNDVDPSELAAGEYFKDYDVILIHYDFDRYHYYTDDAGNRISLVSFTNNRCVYFDNEYVFFGDLNNSYDGLQDTSKLYNFEQYFDLDCGSTTEITKNTSFEFIYKDDASFDMDYELTYAKNYYLSPDSSNMFKLKGDVLLYTQGYDESKYNVTVKNGNRTEIRTFDNNFNLKFSFKNSQETYIDVTTDFDQRFTQTYTNLGTNTVKLYASGYEGEYINIRALTVDSDCYLRTNILNKFNPSTRITRWDYNDSSFIITIYVHTVKSNINAVIFGNTYNYTPDASGNLSISIYCNSVLELTIDDIYVKTTLFISNYHNTELQMPYYESYTTPKELDVTRLISPNYMIGTPSEGKTLYELTNTSECDLSTIESINLDDYTDSNMPNNLTYIYKGYKKVECDTTEVYVVDSTKYVVDDIFFDFGGGYYLLFNDSSEGDSFANLEDLQRNNYNGQIDDTKNYSFLFTIESQKYPETIDRAGWQRVNHYLVTE